MRSRMSGAAIGKYLLLIAFLGLFAGWLYWRSSYGAIGRVAKLDASTAGYVAFIRSDADGKSNLCIVKDDGTDLKMLTSDDAPKRMPCWSPDGSRLVYAQETRSEGSASYQLFVLGQGAPKQATYGSLSKDMPQWRPDGKWIAYLAGGAIKVVTPNGAETEQIYPRPAKGNSPVVEGQAPPEDADGLKRPPITWYRWAPVGGALAGIQVLEGENAAAIGRSNWWGRPGQGDDEAVGVVEPESIVVLPHLQAEPVRLPGADRVGFSWYPDGRRIAVALQTRKGRHALVIFRTDEKNLPVTPILSADSHTISIEHPAVSPDGKQIVGELWRVQASDDHVPLGLVVLPAEPERPIVIEKPDDIASLKVVVKGDARRPQWSPDGSKLLYTMVGPSGASDIWVVNSDGTNAVNLTKGQGDNTDPVWSPARK